MYRIRDLQFECEYLAGGDIFKTKKEACEYLISYHSIDCDMSGEQELLDKGEIDKCWEQLSEFEWRLEPVEE